jgi:hypothetical protein
MLTINCYTWRDKSLKEVQEIETNPEIDIGTKPQSNTGIFFRLLALGLLLAISVGFLVYAKNKDLDGNDLITMANNKIFNSYSKSVGTIKFDSSIKTVFEPFDMGIICAKPEGMIMYNIQGQEEWKNSINLSNPLIMVEGRYMIAADKGGENFYAFHNKNQMWNKTLEGKILAASTNNRGYIGVIYKDNSYKNVVKVYNNKGEEILTRYYSNNYAVSVRIAPDNKTIAIGEVDLSGLRTSAGVLFIPIGSKDDSGWFEQDSILTGMEFFNKELLVSLNNKVYAIGEDLSKKLINNFGKAKVTNMEISKDKFIVKVQKTGDFLKAASIVEILNNQGKSIGTFEARFDIVNIAVNGDKIAVNGGNKVVFIGPSGKQISEFKPKKDVKEIKLLKDGTHAAIIYSDSLDIVNIY